MNWITSTRKSGEHLRDMQKRWTAVSTLLGLISSVYRDLPQETESATTECWAEIIPLTHQSISHKSDAK